ncbi:MAG: relaxase/mobilization nuclease domain-containing protein [Sulfuriferula sp.]
MIAKTIRGKGFRGVLEYDAKTGSVQLDTNLAGTTPRQMTAEFGAVRRLRPGISKPVVHVSLALPPGEHLTDEQWVEAGKKWLHGMGHGDCQYVLTRHTDEEHEHIHIITSRIAMTGEVISDSNDYKRSEQIMRQLERDYGLRQVESSIESTRKAPTKGELEESLRTGTPSTRAQLQQICDQAAADCSGIGEYINRLQSIGITVTVTTQVNDTRLVGLLFDLDGVKMKASDLGKAYTPTGLLKRGVSYDKDRDFEAVCRANISATERADHGANRSAKSDGRGEHRPTYGPVGTVRAIDGGLDRDRDGECDGVPYDNRRTEPVAQADGNGNANAVRNQDSLTPTSGWHDQNPRPGGGSTQPSQSPTRRPVKPHVNNNSSDNRRLIGIGGHAVDDVYAALNCNIKSADNHSAEQKAKLKKRYTEQLATKLKDAKLTYTKAGLIIYHRGGRAVDQGDIVTIAKITDRNIALMLDIAEGKGWENLVLIGSEEFRKQAAVEAVRRGFMLDDLELDKYAREQLAAHTASIASTPPAPPTPTAAPPNKATTLKEQVAAELAAAARNSAPTPQQIAAAERERERQAQMEREREDENDFGHDM